jgi:hypothetical protein
LKRGDVESNGFAATELYYLSLLVEGPPFIDYIVEGSLILLSSIEGPPPIVPICVLGSLVIFEAG